MSDYENARKEISELATKMMDMSQEYSPPAVMMSLILTATAMIAISKDPELGYETFTRQLRSRLDATLGPEFQDLLKETGLKKDS